MHLSAEVGKGLPPGLWLPTHDEPTDQYRVENFNRPDHPYEAIVDYGSFVVALASLDEQRQSSSLMPTVRDFQELFESGYGLQPSWFLRTRYGGLKSLQQTLGFYPRGYYPDEDELTKRLIWLKEYSYPLEEGEEALDSLLLEELIIWGSNRRLSPAPHAVYRTYGSDTTSIRRQLGLERRDMQAGKFPSRLFRLGAKLIAEHGGPVPHSLFYSSYAAEYNSSAHQTVLNAPGNLARFWSEFGYVSKADKLKPDQLVSLGVRWAIEHGGQILNTGQIIALSKESRFPSKMPIQKQLGKISVFREQVRQAYEKFSLLALELESVGVASETISLVGRRYEVGDDFEQYLRGQRDTLIKISGDSEQAVYVRKLMRSGLELIDEELFNLQREDILSCLRSVGIKTKKEIGFVLGFFPRLDTAETLAYLFDGITPVKVTSNTGR